MVRQLEIYTLDFKNSKEYFRCNTGIWFCLKKKVIPFRDSYVNPYRWYKKLAFT